MLAKQSFLEVDGNAWLRGDTIPAMAFAIANDDGTPVDLTGAWIIMDILDNIAGVVIASLRTSNAPTAPNGIPTSTITISNAAGGLGSIDQIPPSVTNVLIASKSMRKAKRWYTFELTWDAAPDVVLTPFGGWIEVLPDGT